MNSSLSALIATEHISDLQHEARVAHQIRRAAAEVPTPAPTAIVALRAAGADERDVARRLAELDSAPELHGQMLFALVDGRAVAALSLSDGRIVADPFADTEPAVALLRLRERQLRGEDAPRGLAARLGVRRRPRVRHAI